MKKLLICNIPEDVLKGFKIFCKSQGTTMAGELKRHMLNSLGKPEPTKVVIEKINSKKEETPIKKDGERILVDGKRTQEELENLWGL